jgi:uncharacterized protein (DUF2147 family)
MRAGPSIALLSLWLAATPVAARDELHAEWITPGYSARVRIHPCESAPDTACGTITWLWESVDRVGAPVRDGNNGDDALRERPLQGLEILAGLRQTQPGRWGGGTIYNPEDGRRYSVNLRLRSAEVLEVEGCVLFICRLQIWRRRGAGI